MTGNAAMTPQMRAAWSRLHEGAGLHPVEERAVRADMTDILTEHRAETGIADIAALTAAGYADAIAIDIGCDIAVDMAVRSARTAPSRFTAMRQANDRRAA